MLAIQQVPEKPDWRTFRCTNKSRNRCCRYWLLQTRAI